MKDDNGQNHYAVDPFAAEPGEAAEPGGEAAVIRLAARYGLNLGTALAFIADVQDEFGAEKNGAAAAGGVDALRKLNARHRLAWHILISYQANQKTYEEVCAATRVMALVLGFKTAAGAETIADLERKTGIKKQTLNKPRIIFREKLGLPPEGDERCEAARANMTGARKNQLCGK